MISSPTLLVDEQKCRSNIERMALKAKENGLDFRPHFKTHQSADIGEWFRHEGVRSITVSSVKMAEYFAGHGWEDITIAFPVNIRELDKIDDLASRITLTLLISDSNTIKTLQRQLTNQVNVVVELDTGSHRSGFEVSDLDEIDQLIEKIDLTAGLKCRGFYSHPGHSYAACSRKGILEVHADVLEQLAVLRSRYDFSSEGYAICIGDTPCCSVADDFSSIDQISPGNFVFYDVMQTQIGSCSKNDIAVALACPVVAKYPAREEIVVYGGAVHLSKEVQSLNGHSCYGLPVHINEDGWEVTAGNGYVKALSQEHGTIKCRPEFINSLEIGDTIGILPIHSCLSADLMMGYRTLGGGKLNHLRSSS